MAHEILRQPKKTLLLSSKKVRDRWGLHCNSVGGCSFWYVREQSIGGRAEVGGEKIIGREDGAGTSCGKMQRRLWIGSCVRRQPHAQDHSRNGCKWKGC